MKNFSTSSTENTLQQVNHCFTEIYGEEPIISELRAGGSGRRYFRLKSTDKSLVGAYGHDIAENKCFIDLARIFENEGIRVPHIFHFDAGQHIYFMEDLGNTPLLEALNDESKRLELAKKALRQLYHLQTIPESKWSEIVINAPFSEKLVRWDLNYFKYDFLKAAGIDFNEYAIEHDFDKLTDRLVKSPASLSGLMYRDFQSRNIMIKGNDLYFIDFQGARKGPILYDLISFLWQAKAPFTPEEKEVLKDYYIKMVVENLGIPYRVVDNEVMPMVLFRTLQVLGAYGLRGLIERKQHFIESIPHAIKNLQEIKERGALDSYPEIKKICNTLLLRFPLKEKKADEGLLVTVGSFSFKKGYPQDDDGNGGGFVFDCRGLPNPGRIDIFKPMTGMDSPVISFLEDKEEVRSFIDNGLTLIMPSIDNYLARNFNSLHVWFGCTGGRHRSVYCAENFSKTLKKHYQHRIKIRLIHREQNKDIIF